MNVCKFVFPKINRESKQKVKKTPIKTVSVSLYSREIYDDIWMRKLKGDNTFSWQHFNKLFVKKKVGKLCNYEDGMFQKYCNA